MTHKLSEIEVDLPFKTLLDASGRHLVVLLAILYLNSICVHGRGYPAVQNIVFLTFALDTVATGMFVDLVNWKLASDAWALYPSHDLRTVCDTVLLLQ